MNGDDNLSNFTFFRKATSIPSPSQYFVFIDESSDTIDNAHFLIGFDTDYNNATIRDNPAVYHGMSGNLSYADGHAASKKWDSKPVDDTQPDGLWLMQHGSLPADGTAWPGPLIP
jgi:prepilin-type processing-associated H-X9-DG protein